MYNLSLLNLCATRSNLATLRLPTVDPYSAEVSGRMRSHTVLCGDLYMSRLWACGPVIPRIPWLAGVAPARYASGCYGGQVRYGD